MQSLLRIPKRVFASPAFRSGGRSQERRRQAVERSLDYALEYVAQIRPLPGRIATLDDALLAVKASHTQCGPVARLAEAYLARTRVRDVVFHNVGGHYVLRDSRTGLLHDLEAPQGCRHREQLPISSRLKEMRDGDIGIFTDGGNAIFEKYAAVWLANRVSRSPNHSFVST